MTDQGSVVQFDVNSQDLYGAETLREAASQGAEITAALNASGHLPGDVQVVFNGVTTTSDGSLAAHSKALGDARTIAHAVWCKTFSPAQMHTEGLLVAKEGQPFAVMHTQFQPRIPAATLDQNYMNNNQDAHGGREFCHGVRQVGLDFTPFTGDWRGAGFQRRFGTWVKQALAGEVVAPKLSDIATFPNVAPGSNPAMERAVAAARGIRCVRFGGKMRQVHVTDGNPSAARVDLGWEVLDYGVGDLADAVAGVRRDHLNALVRRWTKKYGMDRINADPLKWESVIYQARLYLAIKSILKKEGATAFTTSFQQTHGLEALPGLAVQELMSEGYGFGPEGDWKTACLGRLIHLALKEKSGARLTFENATQFLV